jgi:uncharacterized protein YbaP (TraB family)
MNFKNTALPAIKNLFLIGFISIFILQKAASQTSQDRAQYKLLWKITGKNLRTPSYLFGTMHVYDNKAFDFSDSVLLNLLACDAFAMEVHPDSVMNSLVKMIFNQSDQKKNVFKEIFSEKEYKEIDSMLRAKSGYSLDKLKSPSMAEFALEKNDQKSKDKSTFLDAYLYGIARSNKKQIIGLENASDQLSIIDHLSPTEIKKIILSYLQNDSSSYKQHSDSYNQLLNIYYSGDIDKIYELMRSTYSFSKEYYDRLITIRNEGMAKNIISSITSRSTFVAVGAAHLPGNEGLIKLLQKEGYDVTKVSSPFSGLANKYKYKSEESTWNNFTFPNGSYSIKMPVAPVPLQMDSIGITLQMSFDLAAGAIYQSTFISLSNNFNLKESKEILDRFEETFKRKGKQRLEKSQKIFVEGYEGREFWTEDKDDYFKVRIILREKTLYLLMVGPTKEHANSADSKVFFDSFKPLPYPESSWKECLSSKGAFKIDHWGDWDFRKVDYNDAESGIYHLNIFSSSNIAAGESYLLRYNDFPAGRVSYNDSLYYQSLIQDFYKDLNGSDLSVSDKTFQGFKGKEFSFKMGADEFVKGRVFLRGNRCYFLLTTSTKPLSKNIDHFLESIHFVDYEATTFKEYDLKNSKVSIDFPSQPVVDDEDKDYNKYILSNGVIYNSTDDKTGISYILIHRQLGKYHHYKSTEHFLQNMKEEYFSKGDSLIDSVFYLNNKSISKEYIAAPSSTNTYKKIKITLNGKDVFVQMAYLPKDYLKNLSQSHFFNSLKLSQETHPVITSSQKLLFEDLSSQDTVVAREAKDALQEAIFDRSDTTQIFKALQISYKDDAEEGGIKSILLDALANFQDVKVKNYIKAYTRKIKSNDNLKVKGLTLLSSFKTRESVQDLMELLTEEIPTTDEEHASSIFYPLYDSIQLAVHLYPNVLNVLQKEEFQEVIFFLTNRAIEDSILNTSQISEIEKRLNQFLERFKEQNTGFSKEDEFFHEKLERYKSLLILLNNLKFTPNIASIAEKFIYSEHSELAFEALKILLKNKQPVSSPTFELVAGNPLLRLQLYHYLEEIGQSDHFPKTFLNKKAFAESSLVEYLSEDDGTPNSIEFITEKRIQYKGQKKQLYVYKFKYDSESNWYLGISGPINKSKSPKVDNDLTFSTFQIFDKKKLDELLKELLKGTEAELMK